MFSDLPELIIWEIAIIGPILILIIMGFLWKRGGKIKLPWGIKVSFGKYKSEAEPQDNEQVGSIWKSKDGLTKIQYFFDTENKEAIFGFVGSFVGNDHLEGLEQFNKMLDYHIKNKDKVIVDFTGADHVYSKMLSFILKHSKEEVRIVCTFDQYANSISFLLSVKNKQWILEVLRVFGS